MPTPPELTPPEPSSLLRKLELFGIRLGLESCSRLLDSLGSPHRSVPTVLVAGTNGKGSTAALLAAMGSAAGYRTGLFTSPHLERVEERLRLNGSSIPSSTLSVLLQEILAKAETLSKEPITYFEALAVAAYTYFARQEVDLAIFEVGLGGRLDATNAGDPILSVITSISLDHQEHLGETLSAIAREKAGILRPGMPVVCSISASEALATVREVARGLSSPLISVPEEVHLESRETLGWDGQKVRLRTPRQSLELRTLLLGEHQISNLALALRAAEVLQERGFARLTGGALTDGCAACHWPGRLEVVDLPRGRRILLDAAHNLEAAERLREFLDTFDEELELLFGILEDKDAEGILAALSPRFRRCTLTCPESARARAPEELRAMIQGCEALEIREDLPEALDQALDRLFESEGGTLVVCGSIFLVGPVRSLLRERFGVPEPAVEMLTGPAM